jgi:hypothetical protein
MRAGIQNDMMFRWLPGFPFDFAQGGEHVEPRLSLEIVLLARNDSFVELRQSFPGYGVTRKLRVKWPTKAVLMKCRKLY